jgi:hypothetical protein
MEGLPQMSKEKVKVSRKECILSLYRSGVRDVDMLAKLAGVRTSYAASVLRLEGLIDNYFDLYTPLDAQMNTYSKHFHGRLGFKDVETATSGVSILDGGYRHFEAERDRAGQHHALEMGLMMMNRARFSGKLDEAEVYRRWLMHKIAAPLASPAKPIAVEPAEKPIDATIGTEEPEFQQAA